MAKDSIENNSIISGLQKGDKSSYALLYQKFYKDLCVYARSILKRDDVAEEMVQNVIMKLWEKRDTLQIKENLKAYLFRSVYNQSLNYIKSQKGKTFVSDDYTQYQITDENDDIVKGMENKELLNQIKKAIDELPENTKKVFMMSRVYAMKYKEIAEKLDISVKGVEFHMSKALKLLSEKVKQHALFIIMFLGLYQFVEIFTRVFPEMIVFMFGGDYGQQ